MLKPVLSIVAFNLTFGFSILLVGLLFGFPQSSYDYSMSPRTNCFARNSYKSQIRANVEDLIYQDVSNGNFREYKTYNLRFHLGSESPFSLYAEYVNEYVDNSQGMDDSNLPADFQNAWRNHMKAWRDYSNFLNEQKDSVNQLSNNELQKRDDQFTTTINSTWSETLQIGRSYGADF